MESYEEPTDLSYDDTVPYSEQLLSLSSERYESDRSLAHRIGGTKVYLLSETTGARVGKRKHDEEEYEEAMDEDVDMVEGDSRFRDNAILVHGAPISHLPTSNIFAYATNFDAHPMGLEWIDDTTCILVFTSKSVARAAYNHLAKSATEAPSPDDDSVAAKPIPMEFWPPEDRINKSLGKGEGLKGAIRMRWATSEDVKKRGAKKESEFYKKYGRDAGKEAGEELRPLKKRRGGEIEEAVEKAKLDDDLDAFLAEDDEAPVRPPSPPSKMRSDYISANGRTLLERTSAIRSHPNALASRVIAELPRRARTSRDRRPWDEGKGGGSLSDRLSEPRRQTGGTERTRGRRTERPRKTQQDLDDELDEFLNAKD